MNNKVYKIIVTIFIIVLITFNLFYLFSIKLDKLGKNKIHSNNNLIAKVVYENELKMINPEMKVISLTGDTSNLYSIINNKYVLTIKISNTDCNTCLMYLLELFKELGSDFDTEGILFLVEAGNLREVISFKSANDLNYPIYMIQSKLGLPAEEINKPLLFILNDKFQVNMISFADVENPEVLHSYFNILLKRELL